MNGSTKMIRGYHHFSRAWYSKNYFEKVDDHITVGFYDNYAGTTGEFTIRWHKFDDERLVPCLEAFDDSWGALINFSDVLQKMAEVDNKNISPLKFCELLESCGVIDLTEENAPSKYSQD